MLSKHSPTHRHQLRDDQEMQEHGRQSPKSAASKAQKSKEPPRRLQQLRARRPSRRRPPTLQPVPRRPDEERARQEPLQARSHQGTKRGTGPDGARYEVCCAQEATNAMKYGMGLVSTI